MIRLGICNELFEDWEFGQVCRTVKGLGYEGLEIAPFTLAPRITDLTADRRRELRAMVEDAGLATIGLHWLLAKTEGFYLTSPDPEVRRRTGDYLIALAEATRDLGGSLMVLGSPKQRDLLPGVSHDQALGYALEVFRRVMPAIGATGRRSLPRAAGALRDQFPQHLCPGESAHRPGEPSPFQAPHGRESPERRDRNHGARVDPPARAERRPLPRTRREPSWPRHGQRRFRANHAGARRFRLRSLGLGRGLRLLPWCRGNRAAEYRMSAEGDFSAQVLK